MPDEAPLEWHVAGAEEDDTYLVSNLFPEDARLPSSIQVAQRLKRLPG